MNLEVLVLGLFSGLRPGTSLAALLVLVDRPKPQRLLLVFTAAGFAWSWAIGLVVVAVFHGANGALGGSTFTAVLDVAVGAAALGFAAGLQLGWVEPPTRRRSSSPSATAAGSRFGRELRNPSARDVVAAAVGTHLPGLVYLAALNAIASERPAAGDAALQVAIYDALWFLVPLGSVVLAVVRPVRLALISTWRRPGSVATSTPSSYGARSFSAATSSSRGRHTCSPETAANGRSARGGPLSWMGETVSPAGR